jgi:MFS family permease
MAVILLFSPSFAWLYLMNSLIFDYGPGTTSSDYEMVIGKALFFIAIAFSAIIGSMISKRWKCKRFLAFWIFFGVLTTLLVGVFTGSTFFVPLAVLTGISFGIGFASCLAFIADSTVVEERGRISGITMLVTFIVLPLIGVVLLQFNTLSQFLVVAIFRGISFFALFTDTCEVSLGKKKTWVNVFTTHGFGLYLLSWLMYMAASSTAVFVATWLPQIPKIDRLPLESLGLELAQLGVAFAGFLSGFVADRFGRKKVIIFGLATLGIAYTAYGVTTNEIAYLFTQLFFGASFGIMFSIFFITVIGDFASTGLRERYYAAGSIFLFAYFASQFLSGIFSIKSIPPNVIASILALVLFVAVLPILNAPETLPKEKIRSRRFREHLKKVRELVEEEEDRNNH